MGVKNKEEAVVVFSGGQDSTTCLLWALKNYKKVYTVSFDYGQRHRLELECAKEIAQKLSFSEHTIKNNITSILEKTGFSSMTKLAIWLTQNGYM